MIVWGIFFALIAAKDSFYSGYLTFAKVAGSIYLVYQFICFIDMLYLWGVNWAKKYDAGLTYFGYIMIATAFILYGATITLNVYNFKWFSASTFSLITNIVNAILIVTITVV